MGRFIQGDFNEDQTLAQVTTNTVITMIPIVDQAGDVRGHCGQLKAAYLGEALQ